MARVSHVTLPGNHIKAEEDKIATKPTPPNITAKTRDVVFRRAFRGPLDFNVTPYQYSRDRVVGVTNPMANG